MLYMCKSSALQCYISLTCFIDTDRQGTDFIAALSLSCIITSENVNCVVVSGILLVKLSGTTT